MEEYNISFLIKVMTFSCNLGQSEIGKRILQTVALFENVNVDVDDAMISRLVNRKKDVHPDIRLWAGKSVIYDFAKKQVDKTILPEINAMLIYDACSSILRAMNSDKTVPEAIYAKLNTMYAAEDFLEFYTFAILYALSRPNALPIEKVQADDFPLLEEAGGACALCGEKLWAKKRDSGNYVPRFRITKIYPDEIPENLKRDFSKIKEPPSNLDADENRITLCLKCSNSYSEDPTAEEYGKLVRSKETLEKRVTNERIARDSEIEDEIVDVIKAIAGVNGETRLQPFTEVLKVEEKIRKKNHLLQVEVIDDVLRYYPFVEKQFSLYDGTQKKSFNTIRGEVSVCYEKLEQEQVDQSEIRELLIDWLLEKNGLGPEHRVAASILISFFIQNCAVFKPHHEGESDGGEDKT